MDEGPSRSYRYALAIICIIGAGLRFRELDGPSMWLDELDSLRFATMDSWEDSMGEGETIMGIYGWIYYNLLNFFGNSDFVARSTSAISGILLIAVISEIGRRSLDEKSGIIAAGIMSASYFCVRYSQEFRPYMIGTLLLWLGILFVQRNNRSVGQKFLIISLLTVSFLIHYLAALAVALLLFVTVMTRTITWFRRNYDSRISRRKNLSDFLSSESNILVASFSLSVLGLSVLDSIREYSNDPSHSSWINETPENPHLVLLNEFFGYHWWGNSTTGLHEILWTLILISPLILIFHRLIIDPKRGVEEEPEWLYWTISLGTLGLVVYYSAEVRPLFVTRYFSYSMPAWFLLIASSISRVIDILINSEGNKEEFTTRVAICIAFIFVLNGTNWIVNDYDYYNKNTSSQFSDGKSDFEGMANWLDSNLYDNEPYIIAQPQGYNWDLYLERAGSDIRVDYSKWGSLDQNFVNSVVEENYSVIIRIQGHHAGWDGENLENSLSETHILSQSISFTKGQIDVYTHPEVST